MNRLAAFVIVARPLDWQPHRMPSDGERWVVLPAEPRIVVLMAEPRFVALPVEPRFEVPMAERRFVALPAEPRFALPMARPPCALLMAGAVYVRGVRPWTPAPYYGAVVAGVAIGAIIATTALPPAPSPQLCWFWSSPAQNQGYWDYCS